MKIVELKGTSPEVYSIVGPYAMDLSIINRNGNPITTSNKHKWYIYYDKDDNVAAFCSVEFAESTRNMQIGNLFVFAGGKRTFNALIRHLIKELVKKKELGLRAYANNKNKDDFRKLGFEMATERVNWHNMKYKIK